MNNTDTMDRSKYGVFESNGLVNGPGYHDSVNYSEILTLAQVKAKGGKITRVRLLTESRMGGRIADVSYIHAQLPSGAIHPVQVDIDCGPMYGPQGVKARMIGWGKRESVFAKGIGLLDEGNWSVLN